MAFKHLSWRSKDGYAMPQVPDAWLGVTGMANTFVHSIARVKGLTTKVGPEMAAASGTAQFLPSLSLIEVNSNKLMPGVDPEKVVFTDVLFEARHPLLHGALSHEVAHARYTTMVPADLAEIEGLTTQMIDVLVLLEESRIERLMLIEAPRTRTWLPSLVWDFLGNDVELGDTDYSAAALAALILARADAGSITWKEAEPFRELVLTRLSEDTLEVLRGLWQEYHVLHFQDGEKHEEAQISIATRWLEALNIDPAAEPEQMELVAMPMPGDEGDGEGESAEGEGEGGGAAAEGESKPGESTEGELGKKAAEEARKASHEEAGKANERVGKIKFDRRQQERDADRTRRAEGEKAAEKAFPPGHGASASGVSQVSHRPPTDKERAASVKFRKHLAKVLYTDRRITRFNTDRPGGRLRGRGAVQRSAQRGAGMRPTALHWKQTRRQTVDEPLIRAGFMTDISGSMRDAVQPMGAAAFIVGGAVNALDGVFASVTFAERVYGVVRPGQKVTDVPVMKANGGWENFKEAFAALDSALDLVDGDGVKILFIASDGVYGADGQPAAARRAIRWCITHNVIPVHLDFTGKIHQFDEMYGSRLGLQREPIRIKDDMSPEQVANIIGAAVIAEVKHYKSRQRVA